MTVVPLPAGLLAFDFEKKLKSAPGADIVDDGENDGERVWDQANECLDALERRAVICPTCYRRFNKI